MVLNHKNYKSVNKYDFRIIFKKSSNPIYFRHHTSNVQILEHYSLCIISNIIKIKITLKFQKVKL